MKIEVSIGEAIDKLSILELKLKKINNEDKKKEIEKEIKVLDECYTYIKKYEILYKLLIYVNESIWDMTDTIKSISVTDSKFPSISNQIFEFNQKRFRIKNWFNLLANSNIKEQKSYSLSNCNILIKDIEIFKQKIINIYLISLEYDSITIISNFNTQIKQLINIPIINYIENLSDKEDNIDIIFDDFNIEQINFLDYKIEYGIDENETEWLNYKVVMPENVNKISNQSNNKPQKLIFDIGANIGNWALVNISEENKIISVEASTCTFNKLVNNVSSYGNIVPLNYAVCDSTDEYITFYESESDILSSLNKEWIYGPESRFNCNYKATLSKTITLDKLIEQYGVPELIKIDVESAEYSCIKSLTKKVNNLCFEWASENQDMILNSLNYLFKLGFREFFIQMNSDDYKFVPNNYYSLNDTKQILLSTIYKRDWGMIHCR